MNRQSSAIVVSPRPATVPRLIEQNSRNTLRSPTTSRVGSPAYLRSCGASPIEANWNTRVSRPSVVGPLTTACGPIQLPAPIAHAGADDGERPDLDARGDLGARGDDRARIDQGLTSGATIIVAEAATSPSTSATVVNFQMPRIARSKVAFSDELVAGHDRPPEARAVDADEIEARLVVRHDARGLEGEDAGRLRQRLQDHDARHRRVGRESVRGRTAR